jgi:hypothetical protein
MLVIIIIIIIITVAIIKIIIQFFTNVLIMGVFTSTWLALSSTSTKATFIAHHQSSYPFVWSTLAPAFRRTSIDSSSPFKAAACSALSPLYVECQEIAPSENTAKSAIRHLMAKAAGFAPASSKNCKCTRITPMTASAAPLSGA